MDLNGKGSATDRSWLKLDADVFEDDQVLALERTFGPGGVFAFLFMLCRARQNEDKAEPPGWARFSRIALSARSGLEDRLDDFLELLERLGLAGEVVTEADEIRVFLAGYARKQGAEAPAERMRRYRQRQREEEAGVQVELDDTGAAGPVNTMEMTLADSGELGPATRPELGSLCELLADEIARVDGAKPNWKLKSWEDAVRLLLDKDLVDAGPYPGRVAQVEKVIRFSQRDEFWRQNILSMPALRKQWWKLVRRMEQAASPNGAGGSRRAVARQQRTAARLRGRA